MNKGYEGYLDKAEDNSNWGSLFGWTRFWFKLVDSRLFFYKKKPSEKEKGLFSIEFFEINIDKFIYVFFVFSLFLNEFKKLK
jgi:hypothetical protein